MIRHQYVRTLNELFPGHICGYLCIDMAESQDSASNQENLSEAVRLLKKAADLLDGRSRQESGDSTPSLGLSCRPIVSQLQPPTPSRGRDRTPSLLQEQRQLFGRLSRPTATTTRMTNMMSTALRGNSNREGNQRWKKQKKQICVLAGRNVNKVPSPYERAILTANGLGDKTVIFPAHGTASEMKSALMSEFPRLEEGGGFELLRTADRSRTNLIVACVGSCSVDHLLNISTGRIYVRPMQSNIAVDYNQSILVADELEECICCHQLVALEQLRKHVKDCKQTTNSVTVAQDELPDLTENPNIITMDTTTESGALSDTIIGSGSEPVVGRGNDTINVDVATESGASSDTNMGSSSEPVVGKEQFASLEHFLKEVEDIHDPVRLLRCYQQMFMKGRPLDITDESGTLVGDTLPIFVSRTRLVETGFKELLDSEDFHLPLEVTFYGEEAEDLGGPRKEFLESILKEMTEEQYRLFQKEQGGSYSVTDDSNRREKKWFYAAGLICGLSILQNGPLPTFIKDFDLMLENPTESQEQFLHGLNAVGLTDPCMRFLFRAEALSDITMRKLRNLLHPHFEDTGSNKRQRQEIIYELFLKYLKEVAAGRREVAKGKMVLGDILKFVTSNSHEPVLGYTLPPKICFVENTYGSLLPTSSTCTNTLYLPIHGVLEMAPGADKLFDMYDLAFANTYFGKR